MNKFSLTTPLFGVTVCVQEVRLDEEVQLTSQQLLAVWVTWQGRDFLHWFDSSGDRLQKMQP